MIKTVQKTLTSVILTVLLFCVSPGFSLAAEGQDISREELEQLEPFPEFYDQMSPEGRLDWLNSQIDQAESPAQNYNFQRALAFEHFFNYRNSEAQQLCESNPPLSFDIRYRFACIQAGDVSYEERISSFLDLYETALEEDDMPMAARVLTAMAGINPVKAILRQLLKVSNRRYQWVTVLTFSLSTMPWSIPPVSILFMVTRTI